MMQGKRKITGLLALIFTCLTLFAGCVTPPATTTAPIDPNTTVPTTQNPTVEPTAEPTVEPTAPKETTVVTVPTTAPEELDETLLDTAVSVGNSDGLLYIPNLYVESTALPRMQLFGNALLLSEHSPGESRLFPSRKGQTDIYKQADGCCAICLLCV